jgi:plasmid stability protein
MAALVLKNVPEQIHKLLKQEAQRHRRSMTQQALAILEQALVPVEPIRLPKAIRPRKAISAEMVVRAIREGRA